MKILNYLFLSFFFVVLSACNKLPFTNEDIQSLSEETITEKPDVKNEDEVSEDELSEDEITLIEESIELTENTTIQNKRVILNMVTIKTFEHDLLIKADEFISNHSIIQSFEEKEKAKNNKDGRNGGSVLIEANNAKGELKLILNGESGGYVSSRKLSTSEQSNLRGRNGRNGSNAMYRKICDTFTLFIFPINTYCRDRCIASPQKGKNGGNGKKGLTGFKGKNGGNSGSFHLKAFHLSDFHLTEIKKTPGVNSNGGKGSLGGAGGRAGRNGEDRLRLCKNKPSLPKNGRRGAKGKTGSNGKAGIKGEVCLEKLKKESDYLQNNNQITNKNYIKENTICY